MTILLVINFVIALAAIYIIFQVLNKVANMRSDIDKIYERFLGIENKLQEDNECEVAFMVPEVVEEKVETVVEEKTQ